MSGREKPIQVIPTAIDENFCVWLSSRFSGDEYAQRIQVIQVGAGNRHGEVIDTHDERAPDGDAKKSKAKPRLSREKLVELCHKMIAAAQLDCDALGRSTTYAALAYHAAMGADSYSRFTFRLKPKNAYVDIAGVIGDDDGTVMSTKLLLGLLNDERRDKRWMMELTSNLLSGSAERDGARIARMEQIIDGTWERQAKLIATTEGVKIAAENATVEREYRRAQMQRENMWTDVTRAGVMESIKILGQIIPGFGQLGMAMLQGQPLPPPPQLTATTSAPDQPNLPAASAQPANTQIAIVPDERKLVERFIVAAEQTRIDANYTVAEKLFGKDDETGKPIEPGIFTREQVAILAGVRAGAMGVEALDALLANSGKPEAVQAAQIMRAVAFLTPSMMEDLSQFLKLRNDARAKAAK